MNEMKKITLDIPKYQRNKLDEVKRKTGKSIAQQVRDAIAEKIEKDNGE